MAMGERLRGFPLSLSSLSHGLRRSQRMARGPEDIQEVMVEPSLLQVGQRETEAVSLSLSHRSLIFGATLIAERTRQRIVQSHRSLLSL